MGSNLGDRVAHLRSAVAALDHVVGVSPVYETDPVGGPEGQGPHLNLVVELDSPVGARALLERSQQLERAADRVRAIRWGPRTLDVDVLWVDGEEVSESDLEVPHPRMWQRRFVLAPLRDLAPDLVTAVLVEQAHGAVRRIGDLSELTAVPPG